MAYLPFAEAAAGSAAAPALDPKGFQAKPSFSPLEWSVIALARRDRVASLREPGRVAVAMGVLFGERPNPRLADPKLEALRRIAVLSWRHGYEVDPYEIRRFVAAGYDLRQYELLVDSIAADHTRAAGRRRAA